MQVNKNGTISELVFTINYMIVPRITDRTSSIEHTAYNVIHNYPDLIKDQIK